MIDYKHMSRRLVLALMVIAAVVLVGQLLRQTVWWLVCAYWGVLTVKNWCDWRGQQ